MHLNFSHVIINDSTPCEMIFVTIIFTSYNYPATVPCPPDRRLLNLDNFEICIFVHRLFKNLLPRLKFFLRINSQKWNCMAS